MAYERSNPREQRKVYWARRSSSSDLRSGDRLQGQGSHGIHPGNESRNHSRVFCGSARSRKKNVLDIPSPKTTSCLNCGGLKTELGCFSGKQLDLLVPESVFFVVLSPFVNIGFKLTIEAPASGLGNRGGLFLHISSEFNDDIAAG